MQGSLKNCFLLFSALLLISCGGGSSNGNVPKSPDPDVVKPKIIGITPQPGTNTFANNDVIKIDFDEAINETAKTNTVLITPYDNNGIISNNSVPLTDVKFTVEKNALIIEILQTLTAITKYQVIVKKVADIAGNEMQGDCEWEFATKGYTPLSSINSTSIGKCGDSSVTPDTTPLTVVSVIPASSPLSLTTPIIITFDKAINTSTLKAGIQLSVKSTQTKITPLPYNISYDASKYEVTLTPKTNSILKYNFQYSLKIKSKVSGLKDRSGISLTDDFIFDFKTNLAPNTTQPIITNVIPKDSTTPIKSNTVISITFSKSMNSTTFKSGIELYNTSKTPKAPLLFSLNYQLNPTNVILSAQPSNNPLLMPDKNYQLIIRKTVTDLLGKPLQNDKIINFNTSATPNQWTWTDGSQAIFSTSVYSGTSYPGNRDSTVSWKTPDGVIWLFGGTQSAGPTRQNGLLNELWRYDPISNQWTEISNRRTTNSSGIYGPGVNLPSNSIFPGGRSGSSTWVDTEGNLWLFGGVGYDSTGQIGVLNDFWKYNPTPTINQWTWVGGANTIRSPGSFGTKGIASINNQPSARSGASTWVDNSGNLWLFGGYFVGPQTGYNDMWKYSPKDNKWTWVDGDKIWVNGQIGFGKKGIYTLPNPIPGAHAYSVHWKDNLGNFWLFGGTGWADKQGRLNDLWKYTPPITTTGTGTWKFIGGSTTVDAQGQYGLKLTPNNKNIPGARSGASSWLDSKGILWLYGGHGVDKDSLTATHWYGSLSDLWKFDDVTLKWTWVHGYNVIKKPAIFSTLGNSTKTTTPGYRSGAASWIDSNNILWLFSGSSGVIKSGFINDGRRNDLWKYTP